MSARGGPLPARGWTGPAGDVGGKQAGADLPGWRQLAPAVPLDSERQQHHRLDTAAQVSQQPAGNRPPFVSLRSRIPYVCVSLFASPASIHSAHSRLRVAREEQNKTAAAQGLVSDGARPEKVRTFRLWDKSEINNCTCSINMYMVWGGGGENQINMCEPLPLR